MMRTFAVIALLACASAARISPSDAKKFEALGNATKKVTEGWKNKTEAQNPKLPVDKLKTIPKHIKNRNAIPEVKSVMVVNSLGGCGRKLNAKKMGLKKSNKAANLWKNSLLQVSASGKSGSFRGKKAPEHPGRESFSVPGAGADQTLKDEGRSTTGSVAGEEPYVTVLKDGWFEVGCYFDRMLTAGDKFGDDADQYKMDAETSVNVSIALYDELILDEDKEAMTPTVCFEFCRTVPDMVYYGIANGGYCYCAPYYHPKPGDESKCDAPCPGDNTVVCGNMKGKSSIFEMHLCDDTAEDLATAMGAAKDALDYYMETALFAKELGEKMAASGKALQTVGGLSGAPGAADNGQKAMVASKALTQGFMGESETYEKCLAAYELGKEYEGKDFTSSGNAIAAEHATKDMKGTVGGVVTGATATHDAIIAAYPAFDQVVFGDEPDGGDAAAMKLKGLVDGDEQAEADFRVASYAFDTTYEPAHSSCTGVSTGAPMMGLGKAGCALACEATVYPDVCVGFSFYTLTGADDICFMFADIETVETFTGPEALIQTNGNVQKADPAAAFCGIKMSLMTTGYKPKGEWKKTSRDFGEGSLSIKEDLTEYSAPSMGDLTMGAVTLKAAP